ELAGRDQIARERHDDLGRQRNAGGFDRHQGDDPAVTAGRDHRDDERGQRFENASDHGASPARKHVLYSQAITPTKATIARIMSAGAKPSPTTASGDDFPVTTIMPARSTPNRLSPTIRP